MKLHTSILRITVALAITGVAGAYVHADGLESGLQIGDHVGGLRVLDCTSTATRDKL